MLSIANIMSMEYQRNDMDRRKLKCLEKNLSQYPLLATKPTWTGHGFEPRPVQ
jgi:hypothetical protein